MKPLANAAPKPKRKNKAAAKREEWARIYGSRERVEWVQALPCVVCGKIPSENAHIVTGGMGRKADYQLIVPLCRLDHHLLHAFGERFNRGLILDFDKLAAETESAWQSYNQPSKEESEKCA